VPTRRRRTIQALQTEEHDTAAEGERSTESHPVRPLSRDAHLGVTGSAAEPRRWPGLGAPGLA